MRITVKPLREEALRAGFASILDRLPHGYSFEEFKGKTAEFDINAFCDGERVVGMLMTRGPELHVAVIPEVRGKWLSRRLIREVFSPIFQQYGEAITGVMPDNAEGKEFTRRLGFEGDVSLLRLGIQSKRFDPMTAAIGIGGSLLSGAISGGASKSAASQQANAANRATDSQLQMFDTQNQQQAPYRQAGQNALGAISAGFGQAAPKMSITDWAQSKGYDLPSGRGWSPEETANLRAGGYTDYLAQNNTPTATGGVDVGQFSHQFNTADLKTQLAPNYDFQLQQGLGATRNAANMQTGLLSGNTLKGINDYAQNFAGNAYQQAFNNYNTNQSNIFNRLSTVAGFGQGANQQSTALAGSLAPSIAQTQVGAGAAQAAGTVGAANAITGGMNNAMGWYSLSNLMNSGAGQGAV